MYMLSVLIGGAFVRVSWKWNENIHNLRRTITTFPIQFFFSLCTNTATTVQYVFSSLKSQIKYTIWRKRRKNVLFSTERDGKNTHSYTRRSRCKYTLRYFNFTYIKAETQKCKVISIYVNWNWRVNIIIWRVSFASFRYHISNGFKALRFFVRFFSALYYWEFVILSTFFQFAGIFARTLSHKHANLLL